MAEQKQVVAGDYTFTLRKNTFLDCRKGSNGWNFPEQPEVYALFRECLLRAEQAERLREALQGLEYPDEPGRFCDHAAEPCPRCSTVRATLVGTGMSEAEALRQAIEDARKVDRANSHDMTSLRTCDYITRRAAELMAQSKGK